MSWIATAIIGGSVLSGLIGSNASQSAASTQAAAQNQASGIQQGMFNTILGQEQPFMQAGYGATNTLGKLLGTTSGTPTGTNLPNGYLTQTFDPSSFTSTPQYQFQMQQGGQAIRNADTPGMGALSGSALKDLMSFNQGLASTYYGNYFNMQQQQQNNFFSRLSGIAGLGQNAATNTGTAGTSLGAGIAQSTAGAGASQAAGTIGSANAITGSVNNGIGLATLMALNGGNLGGAGTTALANGGMIPTNQLGTYTNGLMAGGGGS